MGCAGLNGTEKLSNEEFFNQRTIVANSTFGLPATFSSKNPEVVVEEIPALWQHVNLRFYVSYNQKVSSIEDNIRVQICSMNQIDQGQKDVEKSDWIDVWSGKWSPENW